MVYLCCSRDAISASILVQRPVPVATMFPPSPGFISPGIDLSSSADPQLQSVFFGRLPREIRDMIYHEMWEVSGSRQHVFETEDGPTLGHFPCVLTPREKDTRNEDFERLWDRQQERRPRSLVVDAPWAERMASSWHEHWKCEEAMRASRASGSQTGTLFLPSLLTCRRMYVPSRARSRPHPGLSTDRAHRHQEALDSLYAKTTLVLTSLSLAHRLFVASPSPHTRLLRSLHLSLAIPYEALHARPSHEPHVRSAPCSSSVLRWTELCTVMSNLARFAVLRAVVLRLDVADDNRQWWEVRESWALAAVRGVLARSLVLQLPEITGDAEYLRPYRYYVPRDAVAGSSTLPPSPDTVVTRADGRPAPFQQLERYERRRWRRDGDSVRPQLEFAIPRKHVVDREKKREKVLALFRPLFWS